VNWLIILGEGRVDFSIPDRDFLTSLVVEGFKELGQPFDAEK
jgi:hypothetical protein